MAAYGWQEDVPALQPPPIPPRRRSPINVGMMDYVDSRTPNYQAPPIPFQDPKGKTKVGSSTASSGSNKIFTKTNSMFTQDNSLMGFDANEPPRPFSTDISSSRFMADLEGIDFSGFLSENSLLPPSRHRLSSSMEDLCKAKDPIYPDISAAFRELRTETSTPPLSMQTARFCYKPNMSNHSATHGTAYGWNPSLLDAQQDPALNANLSSASFQASVGVPTNAYIANNAFGAQSTGPAFPASHFFSTVQRQTSSGGLATTSSIPRAASWNDVLEASQPGTADQSVFAGDMAQAQKPAAFDDSVNLIEFQPGLPEHEYLTLDFFDPLYERGRKESVSILDGKTPHYSVGEAFPNVFENKGPPPALRKHIRRESHEIWGVSTSRNKETFDSQVSAGEPNQIMIGFEALTTEQMFGSSDEEFLQSQAHHLEGSAQLDVRNQSEKIPLRPPPLNTSQTARYEKLRKRLFIDPESDAFCQMVAELKKTYVSTDEKTNLGYVLSPIHSGHTSSIQVKVVIHLPFETDPVSFTCDTDTIVEHVISHVLYSASPTLGSQHNTEDYVLKVYDRAEYLCNDQPLSKFEYVHHCMKLDQDITFHMITREQVPRPFIRTVDDDVQMLYFPQEYIKTDDEAVSRDSLDILLDNFYQAVDRLNEQAVQGLVEPSQTQGLRQSVKAVCAILAKIETIEITKSLDRLERIVSDMDNPGNRASIIITDGTDRDTLDAIDVAIRCSFVEELQEAVDQVVSAVKQLVRMYCQTYHTEFYLGLSVAIPVDQTEVTLVQDSFIVHIATAHRLPLTVISQFEEFKVVCTLYHGTHRLHADGVTSCQPLTTSGLCDRVVWDEWLQFELSVLKIPRETRLCITICGIRSPAGGDKAPISDAAAKQKIVLPLGAAAIQLYNERGHLLQGSQLIPMTMGVAADPTMPSCKTLLPDSILLQVNLPDFEKTIYFPPVVLSTVLPGKPFELLTSDLKMLVQNVLEKDYVATLTADEMELIWRYRHYLYEKPTVLPRILQACHDWDWASLHDIHSLLTLWPPIHPTQAFQLLLPQYPALRVREFASESLASIPSDELVDFLPQLIQALKFESYHNSSLARMLLEASCKSIHFAHQFFWLLKGVAAQDASYKRRYELMFVALASVAGDALYQEFRKQEDLVKVMTSVAMKVRSAKDKDSTLKRELQAVYEFLEEKGRLVLPYNPSMEVTAVDMKSCSYFTSNAFPLKLVFKNSNPKADPVYVMYKVSDDLRQDMLTLQMIRIMDMLWLQQGLDLKIITFACLATGPKRGIVELITESETLRKIHVSSGVTGSFKDRLIKEWLQRHNPTELEYKKV